MTRRFIGILVPSLTLLACHTLSTGDKDATRKSATDLSTDDLEDGDDRVPTALWSPSKRQMNASYYFMVGEQEQLRGNIREAREWFEQSYNLDPNPIVAFKMIATQANSGDVELAMQQAQRVVLLYPKDAELRTLYGQILMAKGSSDKARVQFEQAIALAPKRYDSYVALIESYRSNHQNDKAIATCLKLVQMDPAYADGWALLAKLYLTNDKKNLALQPALKAYGLQGQDPEKILILAIAYELNGQSKKAVRLYEELFRLNPTNDELIARMVDLYRQIGDLNEALDLLNDVKLTKESAPAVNMQKAFILWELKRFDEASKLLLELAQQFPESDRLQYMAGLGLERVDKKLEAITYFGKVPKSSQFYVHAEYRAIQILRDLKQYDVALKRARLALNIDSERSPDFYGVIASIYADEEKYKDAVEALRDARSKFPDNIQILFLIGVYQEKYGDKKGCIETMRDVIRQDPKHSTALNYLGYLYAESGENLDEAESLVLQALKLKPNDGFYKDSLGWVYYQKKQFKKALDVLLEANQLIPEEGVVLEHIGDVYRALNQKDRAQEFYDQALKTRLESRDRKRIQDKANI